MGVPAVTARQAPAQPRLREGFKTQVAFELNPTLSLWEIKVKPPSLDGGEPVDTMTMHNKKRRTKAPRKLYDVMPTTFTCAYSPKVYDEIKALINKEGSITFHNSDYSTISDFGYLQKFETTDNEEGKMPEATATIVWTGTDPSDGSESEPLYGAAVGSAGED